MRLLSLSNPTVILALVLGIFMGYLLIFELPGKNTREKAEQNATRLLDFDTDEILGLTIRHSGEEIFLAKTDSGNWSMTKPIQTEADPQEIRGFLETLSDVHFSPLVVETGGDPAEFGLVHPNLEVSIKAPGRIERFRVGDDAPVGNLIFLGRESDGRVVTVDKWVQGALTRTAFDLRKKSILQFNEDGIEGILLTFPDHEIHFEKTGENWIIQKPVRDKVDPESFPKLLSMLKGLRAESFIDPGPDFDRITKELVSPGTQVTLREGASETLVRFFESPQKDRAYVLTKEGEPVYSVLRARMNEIAPELFHYQDKSLVRFDPSSIQKITVDGPQEKYELIRPKGKWTMKGVEGEVQQHLVNRLISQIEGLRAFEPADQSSRNRRNRMSSGLDSPGHTIHLFSSEPEPLETLRIGNEWKGMLFSKGRAALGNVMINKDFLDEIPRKNELIKVFPEVPPAEGLESPAEEPAG